MRSCKVREVSLRNCVIAFYCVLSLICCVLVCFMRCALFLLCFAVFDCVFNMFSGVLLCFTMFLLCFLCVLSNMTASNMCVSRAGMDRRADRACVELVR